jgi:hemerythrin-like metal-binding protein
MAITWSSKYSTNVDSVDEQHKKIIEEINHLLDLMKQGKARSEIGSVIDFLDNYTQKHFADEEEIMARYNCPIAEENKKQHAIFLTKIASYKKMLADQSSATVVTLDIKQDLMDWLINHIEKIDMQLKNCVE